MPGGTAERVIRGGRTGGIICKEAFDLLKKTQQKQSKKKKIITTPKCTVRNDHLSE